MLNSSTIYMPKNPTHSKLAHLWLGTWSIGGYSWGKTDLKESESIIDTALEQGITHIDTAGFSSTGIVEKILSSYLKKSREDLFIITKAGLLPDERNTSTIYKSDSKTLRLTLYQTLDRLGTDYIDLYLLRSSDDLPSSIEALEELKQEGLIRYWGGIDFTLEQLNLYFKPHSQTVHQVKFNPLTRSDSILKAGKQNLRAFNCIHSPLEQGLITSNFKQLFFHDFEKHDIRQNNLNFKDEKIIHWITKLQNTCTDYDISLTQANIAWIYSKPYVDAIVIGTRNLTQLENFIQVAKYPRIEYSQIFPMLEEGFK